MDASDANEDGEDIATRSDTFSSIQASTDLVELDEEEHEYNNFEYNLGLAEDEEECVEPHNETSSKPSEDIFELDQHSDNNIVADIMLNSAQDNAEQNVSHSWPYFLSPYQAITLTYIKEL